MRTKLHVLCEGLAIQNALRGCAADNVFLKRVHFQDGVIPSNPEDYEEAILVLGKVGVQRGKTFTVSLTDLRHILHTFESLVHTPAEEPAFVRPEEKET